MRYVLVLAFGLLISTPCQAGMDAAIAAYERGDFATALQEFAQLAKQGDIAAQFNLGIMYEYGEGTSKNLSEAWRWYQAAAEQGHAASQLALAFTLTDQRLAYFWVQQALANTLTDEERRAASHRRAYLVEVLKLTPSRPGPAPRNRGPIVRDYSTDPSARDKWAAVFNSHFDFVLNPGGSIPFVEYFDYRCGPCKRAFKNVQKLQSSSDQHSLRFIFKEFPVLGPTSKFAAKAAIAARGQGKYLQLHNALMGHRGSLTKDAVLSKAEAVGLDIDRLTADMESPAVQSELDANRASAKAMGISGTPSFVIGEKVVRGGPSYARMVELIERAKKSCRVC